MVVVVLYTNGDLCYPHGTNHKSLRTWFIGKKCISFMCLLVYRLTFRHLQTWQKTESPQKFAMHYSRILSCVLYCLQINVEISAVLCVMLVITSELHCSLSQKTTVQTLTAMKMSNDTVLGFWLEFENSELVVP
jgi:cytochrome b561